MVIVRVRRAIDILRVGFSVRDCVFMYGDVRLNVDEEVLDDDVEYVEWKEGVVYLFFKWYVDGFVEVWGVNCLSSEKFGKR